MLLLDECRLRLDDLVERWLPELADRRVLKRIDGWYNRERIQKDLDWQSPDEYEAAWYAT